MPEQTLHAYALQCVGCGNESPINEGIAHKLLLRAGKLAPSPGKTVLETPPPLTKSLDLHCRECSFCSLCMAGRGADAELLLCEGCGFFFHSSCLPAPSSPFCDSCSLLPALSSIVGKEVPLLESAVLLPSASHVPFLPRPPPRRDQEDFLPSGPNITKIFFDGAWGSPNYSSPYPEEYVRKRILFICKKCLSYFDNDASFSRHSLKCRYFFPPGTLVYFDPEGLAIFKVLGSRFRLYCQNLCLLSKMFLEHKTLYYDVDSFSFFILCKIEKSLEEFTLVGYFSKEALPDAKNNLSCLVVFPLHRGSGFGRLLIDYSYFLSREEPPPYRAGPEEPLSEEGGKAYSNYWMETVAEYIERHSVKKKDFKKDAAFDEMSRETGIPEETLKEAYTSLLSSGTAGSSKKRKPRRILRDYCL